MNTKITLRLKSLVTSVIIFLAIVTTIMGFAVVSPQSATATVVSSLPSVNSSVKVSYSDVCLGDIEADENKAFYNRPNVSTTIYSFTAGNFGSSVSSGQAYIPMNKTLIDGQYVYASRKENVTSSSLTKGNIILSDCSEEEASYLFSTTANAVVMSSFPANSSNVPCDMHLTFGLSEELRKVLKDKMLVVTATPYVITAGGTEVQNQFGSSDYSNPECADINLFFYDGTNISTDPEVPQTSIKTLSSRLYTSLPIEDKTVLGASGQIPSGEYGDNSFLQVSLSNWKQIGDFTVAIQEIGIRLAVTVNTNISIATVQGTGRPSSSPDDLNKVTTCFVMGDDRHASAPSTFAKQGDILDINIVLRTNSGTMTIDTAPYTLVEPAFEDCKDGTMFRRLFLNPYDENATGEDKGDEFLITWDVKDGGIVEGSDKIDADNKSGQAVQFQVNSGGSSSGLLILRPNIMYRNLTTGILTKINNQREITISVTVDSNSPNVPALDKTNLFYQKYIDFDTGTFYTNVQSNVADDDRDSEGNLIRLLVTGTSNKNRPIFSSTSLDTAGGSDIIVYYKTTYIGTEIPSTIIERNSTPFTGPIYKETATGSKTFRAFEGKLSTADTYYKMKIANVGVGNLVTANKYYVRNLTGDYVLTEDTAFKKGITYYTAEEYLYAMSGEFAGIYAESDGENCDYSGIYLNMITGKDDANKTIVQKSGVWTIEFVTYDLVGKKTMCTSKSFLQVDITDYEFIIQYYLGGDGEQTQINTDNFRVTTATVDDEGKKSSYDDSELVDYGDVQNNIFRLRRANKVCIKVEFKDTETYNKYILTEFNVGNTNFSTKDYVYISKKTDLDYAFFNLEEENGVKKVYYTFEVDASFCMDSNLRIMKFMFKEKVAIEVTGYTQIFDGNSKPITTTVPSIQSIGGNVNVVTTYYTSNDYLEESKVKYGDNDSNVPVEAGTYYYYSEILNHGRYYGKAKGTLTILRKQPSLTAVNENIRINYGDSLAKIDFDPENRNNFNQQQPGTGITAVFKENNRDYFIYTLSGDKVPGYYELLFDDKTIEEYVKPKAGTIMVTIQFTPVKGVVAGIENVIYEYDEKGNFIQDTNYEIVTCERSITVVHDDKVTFKLNQSQNGGIIYKTTMASGGEIKEVEYVEYTYNGTYRSIEYTLKSAYEMDALEPTEFLNLKEFSKVTYALADSLTINEQKLSLLKYVDTAPMEAGIYAVKVSLNESKCNYSKNIYTYIHIKKIPLTVKINSANAIFDYQYEGVPIVDIEYNGMDYNNVVEDFKYEYFYYVAGWNKEQLTAEENAVKEDDMRSVTGNPIKAGKYFLKITIVDPNYSGEGTVIYEIKQVNNDNLRFSATWPNVNGSQINPQYNISYGQPIKEISLGSSSSFSYAYLNYKSSGSTSTEVKTIPGKVYVVSKKYETWLSDNEITEDTSENRKAYLLEMSEEMPNYQEKSYGMYLCFSAYSEKDGEIIFDKNFGFIYDEIDIYVGKAELDWSMVEIQPITYGESLISAEYNIWLNNRSIDNAENLNIYLSEYEIEISNLNYEQYWQWLTNRKIDNETNRNIYFEEWLIRNQKENNFGNKAEFLAEIYTLNISKDLGRLYSVNGKVPPNAEEDDYYIIDNRYVYFYIQPGAYQLTENKPSISVAGIINIDIKALFSAEDVQYKIEYIGNRELVINKKELVITYTPTDNKPTEEKVYHTFNEQFFYNQLGYSGYIGATLPVGLTGSFMFCQGENKFAISELIVGEYETVYTLQHSNYSGTVSFGLKILPSKLAVETLPTLAEPDKNIVYDANIKSSIGLLGGKFISEGGESISYMKGNVIIGGVYRVYNYDAYEEKELTNTELFPSAGKKIRIYFDFIPKDSINYSCFLGNDGNGGFIDVFVSKADISSFISLSTQKNSYTYKELVYTDDILKGEVVSYSLNNGMTLDWNVEIENARGERPAYNAYLNAGIYTIRVKIDDDNYMGEKTCDVIIDKKDAIIQLKSVGNSLLIEQNGVLGIKKAFKGSSQTLDFDVYEMNNSEVGEQISEAVSVIFSQDGAIVWSIPSAIGFYDATLSLSGSVNYALIDDEGNNADSLQSFLIIGVDLSVIEMLNIEQVYTVQKTVGLFMGTNNAECHLSYEKDGIGYRELPIEAGIYDIYLNFYPYENNGYEDKINAMEITDGKGNSRGYKLVINPYYTEISAPNYVTAIYTGKNGEKFSPYTSPYGLALEYSYRIENSTDDYTIASLAELGALDAGKYSVLITIKDKNYYGEKDITYFVNKAKLVEKTAPKFGDYMYNTEIPPEYLSDGAFVFESQEVEGEFSIDVERIKTLSVGEHTVNYIFTPNSGNFSEGTGTVKLKVVKQELPEDFIKLGDNGNALVASDYTIEYNNTRRSLKVRFDSTKIYGYPKENGDFAINLKYTINGSQQSPLAIGTYEVTAEISSKNYTGTKTWAYKLVITKGTPIIEELPKSVRTFVLGETLTSADLTGGKAVVNATGNAEVFGAFTVQDTQLLSANMTNVAVVFVPTDSVNYNNVNLKVKVNVIGDDPVSIDDVILPCGQSVRGSDWTEKVIMPLFMGIDEITQELSSSHSGSCGVIIKISPKSGMANAEYGVNLGSLKIEFKAINAQCEKCNSALAKLTNYGTLSFVKPISYVPSAGEAIEVQYKLTNERVNEAFKYNNITGLIDSNSLIKRKELTEANSDFEVFAFGENGANGYALNVYDKLGQLLIGLRKTGDEVVFEGAFASTDTKDSISLDVSIIGNNANVSLTTKNYTINNINIGTEVYHYIDTSDISVAKQSKAYDGKALSIDDLDIVVRNTQVAVSKDACSIKIYDTNNQNVDGIGKGIYKVVILVKDTMNKYYGFREILFTITARDVSEELYLIKAEKTVSGKKIYYDSYNSGSHTKLSVGLFGEEISQEAFKAEIKYVGESDDNYREINILNSNEYIVKITVSGADYSGTAYFNYIVYPQEIRMNIDSLSYSVDFGSSEQASFNIVPNFADNSGEIFTFDEDGERGGYKVYYLSAFYPKQTKKPINAGVYTILVEADNKNYTITNGTLMYTIKPRATRIEVAPTISAVDEIGNNIIYGQALSSIGVLDTDARVTDSLGNYVEGSFAVKKSEIGIKPDAGKYIVTIVFTPYSTNYAITEKEIEINVAKRIIKIELENISAFYNGANKKSELSYKKLTEDINIIFEFINATGQTVDPVTAGVYTIVARVSGNNYKVELSTTSGGTNPLFTIKRAEVNKELIVNPIGSEIGVGESLNKSALSGGKVYYRGFSAPIKGSFSYVEGGRAYNTAGEKETQYIFIPDDNNNFASFTGKVVVTVGRGSATVTPGENIFTYGTPTDFSQLKFTTLPAGLENKIEYEFLCDGKTYRNGEIIPAGTYWFTCWINDENYVSERTPFAYIVNKKEIDIDFVNENGNAVTAYSVEYGNTVKIDVTMYSANINGKKTYLLQDEATMKSGIVYRYVSRGETEAYEGFNSPVNIGSYDLTVTLKHDNYVATKTVIFKITTGTVQNIEFDTDTLINQTYGSVVAPIVKMTPSDVEYYIIYQGYNATLPTAVGSYNITVYVDDDNYASTQISAVFRINPKPLEITDIKVKDKAYDGVDTLEINGKLTGVQFNDEVKLSLKATTFGNETAVGEYFVKITAYKITGLHASNYTLAEPIYDGKVKIYTKTIKDITSNSYIISNEGFADGTKITFSEINTKRNETDIWSKMLGVEATVTSYMITVNNTSGINANQYKICVEIPEQYRNAEFTVKFDGALKDLPISYTREGNYISFYASTSSGEVIFETAEFKYGYVVTASLLIIILIAVVVLFILNPMQHRRKVTDPNVPKEAIKRIKKENKKIRRF